MRQGETRPDKNGLSSQQARDIYRLGQFIEQLNAVYSLSKSHWRTAQEIDSDPRILKSLVDLGLVETIRASDVKKPQVYRLKA